MGEDLHQNGNPSLEPLADGALVLDLRCLEDEASFLALGGAAAMSLEDPMQPCAYAMWGLAFSGKSTAARRVAAELGLALISLDAINAERGLDGGGGLPVAEWERTSHIAMARLGDALAAGRSAVVDDTFSHRFLRDCCRGVAARAGAGLVLLALTTPLDVIARRRAANARRPDRPGIDDDVFTAHRDGFQHPSDDEAPVRIGSDADLAAWITSEKAKRPEARHGMA